MLNYKIVLLVFTSMILFSCKKNWIDERSNKALDVPTSIADFQALLDNADYMNDFRPSLGELSADNYYLTPALWQGSSTVVRNAYTWSADIYNGLGSDNINWNFTYRQVFYANIVLDDIDDVAADDLNTPAWSNAKGSAFYYRADAFFNVAQLFAKPYSLTFPDELGIPLRLNADPNGTSTRASLQATYQQILKDLQSAVDYLPNIPLYRTRPSRPAAFAMLSRVYLVMKDYSKALGYADSCLKLYDSILDYNTLKTNVTYPVPGFNREVIYQATIGDDLALNYIVDSNLYKSYAANDLRKSLFFKPNQVNLLNYYGTYTGGTASNKSKVFGGIATDEVYLTRAECFARTGNLTAAMNDLNSVMSKRWKTGTFVPFNATNSSDAINLILQERRKETPFRGIRWWDLRRLNSDGTNITLTRSLNNQTYTLAPNDPRYVLPIPPDIIAITGMAQNER